MMSIDWHDRYLQQARWTQDMRAYLYAQISWLGVRQVYMAWIGAAHTLS